VNSLPVEHVSFLARLSCTSGGTELFGRGRSREVCALVFLRPAQAGAAEGEVSNWLALDTEIKDSGAFVYETGFQPQSTARTVSVRDGQASTEDGGVAKSGDVVAGLYVVDVADVEEAVEWAKRIPAATYGKVEIRPVVES
jgi:hypothetical protein